MAVLWLHAGSLLLLLVLSCPGSQAVPAPQHLCGSNLVDALYMICGDTGFFYSRPNSNPRKSIIPEKSEGRVPVGSENQDAASDFQDQRERIVGRSIIDDCCIHSCTIYELQNYCS